MKKCPPSEKVWLRLISADGKTYYITSKQSRDMYFLYDENWSKIAKSKNPLELDDRI